VFDVTKFDSSCKAVFLWLVVFIVLCNPAVAGSSYPAVDRGRGPGTLLWGSRTSGLLHIEPHARGGYVNPDTDRRKENKLRDPATESGAPCLLLKNLAFSSPCCVEPAMRPAWIAAPSTSRSCQEMWCSSVQEPTHTGRPPFSWSARFAMTGESVDRSCVRTAPAVRKHGIAIPAQKWFVSDGLRFRSPDGISGGGATVLSAPYLVWDRSLLEGKHSAEKERPGEKVTLYPLGVAAVEATRLNGIMHVCRSP
jgi:hypothetical protein